MARVQRLPDHHRITAHFRAGEFRRNDGVRLPLRAEPALQRLCRLALEPLRHRFGVVIVHSAWRTERHNRAVGGAPLSFHRWDLRAFRFGCADVSCARGTPEEWFEFLVECSVPGVGGYDTHVHADMRSGPKARWHG